MVTQTDASSGEAQGVDKEIHKIEDNREILLQASMDGFWAIALNGKILEVNDTYVKMSGYSKQELLSFYVKDLEAIESPEEIIQHIGKVVEKGSDRFETLHRRKDGSTFDVEISIRFDPSYHGRIILFIRDITDRKSAERKLQQSEQRYKALFYGSNSVVLLIDQRTGQICDANPAACSFYGYTHQEICSMNIRMINTLPPDEIKAEMTRSANETKNHFFFKHRLANGDIRDVEVYSGPIAYENTVLLYSVVHDISERIRTEKALMESERLLQESQAMATIGSFSVNLADNTCTISEQMNRIFGINGDKEYTVDLWLGCLHPDFRMKMASVFNDLKTNGGTSQNEYKIIRINDGKERWVNSAGKVEYGPDGNPVRIIGTIQDITPRKIAETQLLDLYAELEDRVQQRTAELMATNQALHAAEQKYRTVADFTYDWEYWISPEGEYIYVSPSCERVSGYPPEAFFENRNLTIQIIHPEETYAIEQIKLKRKTTSCHRQLTYRIYNAQGEIRWVRHIWISIYGDSGRFLGIRGSYQDVTGRKKLEAKLRESYLKIREQQESMLKAIIQTEEKEKALFSKELHDGLGPLLSAIKLYLQWSERPQEGESHREIIAKTEEILEEAINTVREISNRLSPHLLANYGLKAAIESYAGKITHTSGIQIDINCSVDKRLPEEIEATIYRALTECINNTVKHAEAKKITIIINLSEETLVVNYADDGKGFDVDNILSENKGLGLTNIQHRVNSLGGKLKLQSKSGSGVNYNITIKINGTFQPEDAFPQ